MSFHQKKMKKPIINMQRFSLREKKDIIKKVLSHCPGWVDVVDLELKTGMGKEPLQRIIKTMGADKEIDVTGFGYGFMVKLSKEGKNKWQKN